MSDYVNPQVVTEPSIPSLLTGIHLNPIPSDPSKDAKVTGSDTAATFGVPGTVESVSYAEKKSNSLYGVLYANDESFKDSDFSIQKTQNTLKVPISSIDVNIVNDFEGAFNPTLVGVNLYFIVLTGLVFYLKRLILVTDTNNSKKFIVDSYYSVPLLTISESDDTSKYLPIICPIGDSLLCMFPNDEATTCKSVLISNLSSPVITTDIAFHAEGMSDSAFLNIISNIYYFCYDPDSNLYSILSNGRLYSLSGVTVSGTSIVFQSLEDFGSMSNVKAVLAVRPNTIWFLKDDGVLYSIVKNNLGELTVVSHVSGAVIANIGTVDYLNKSINMSNAFPAGSYVKYETINSSVNAGDSKYPKLDNISWE